MASTSAQSSALTPPNVNDPGDASSGQASAHVRSYQACIPCRDRKVKCDLGPVDNPHDPPCARCRRESKECYFSKTRRKRKTEGSADASEEGVPDDYELRHRRKTLRADSSSTNRPLDVKSEEAPHSGMPLTPGGSVGASHPLMRPGSQPLSSNSNSEDDTINDDTTSKFQKTELLHSQDAMSLFGALPIAKTERGRSISAGAAEHEAASSLSSMRSTRLPTAPTRTNNKVPRPTADVFEESNRPTRVVREFGDPNPAVEDAINAWSRVRFVKSGWFSPVEGIDYIEYFYEHLNPLTPVTIPDFRDPAKHGKLLSEEPVLAITLLTISSRYCTPRGRGAITRAYTIHDELWRHLQQNLNRVLWAQEKFSVGAPQTEGEESQGGFAGHTTLRSIGTIESLILLTEWHCRSLHFPSNDDNSVLIDTPKNANMDSSWRGRGQNINSWLEPSWRSERMCWSLLSIAMALAFELRIFDAEDSPLENNENDLQSYRTENVKKLLFVYITQTSGRLSLKSMLPELDQYSQFSVDPVDFTAQALSARNQSSRDISQETIDQVVLYFWYELTRFMKDGNRDAFPSRRHTRELIGTGQYVGILTAFNARLAQLRQKFDDCAIIPQHMRLVLKIEFEYNRVYSNSLALHAVVERCRNNGGSESSGLNGSIAPEVLWQWSGRDRPFINEIIQAANSVLHCVGHVLGPRNLLKFAPVRTFFRIVSVSMVLLKCFACGLPAEDAAKSLGLLNRTSDALGKSVVDDVHVGSQMGEVLQMLTQRVRSSAIRVSGNNEADGNNGKGGNQNGSGGGQTLSSDTARQPQRKTRPNKNAKKRDQFTIPGGEPRNMANNGQDQIKFQTSPTASQQTAVASAHGPQASQSSFAASPATHLSTQTPRSIDSIHGTDDPLYGINQYDFDPSNPSVSLIPPTSFNFMNPDLLPVGGLDGIPASADRNVVSGNEIIDAASFEWVGLPLEPIMRNNGEDVFQAGLGPQFGDLDMLDVYAPELDLFGDHQNFYSN